MNKNYHHRALFLFSLFNIVFVGVLYAYTFNAIDVYGEKITALRQEKTDIMNSEIQGKELARLYSSTEDKWKGLASHFVLEDDQVSFIESLEAIGAEAGSKLKIISVQSDDTKGTTTARVGEIHAKVEATGSWNSVMKTIKLTEIMPYAVSIKDARFDLVMAGASKNVHEWRVAFDVGALELDDMDGDK